MTIFTIKINSTLYFSRYSLFNRNLNLTTAISDMTTAYTDASGRTPNYTGIGGEIGSCNPLSGICDTQLSIL